MDSNCAKCKNKLNWLLIITSLFLSLVKGLIGILGSCESLVADGLFSFYQSFTAIRLLWFNGPGQRKYFEYSALFFSGLVVGLILLAGTLDVFVFSIIRIIKASQDMLMRPSPYALYTAILSILASQLLYRYNLCGGVGKAGPDENTMDDTGAGACRDSGKTYKSEKEITENLKLSMIISTIVIIGICFARFKTLYGDPIAALITIAILSVKLVPLLRDSAKGLMDTLSGIEDRHGKELMAPEVK